MEKFTDQIRETCRKTGITIQKLFPRLGLSPKSFYVWEKAPGRMSEDSLIQMDRGLDELIVELNQLRLRVNCELKQLRRNKGQAA